MIVCPAYCIGGSNSVEHDMYDLQEAYSKTFIKRYAEYQLSDEFVCLLMLFEEWIVTLCFVFPLNSCSLRNSLTKYINVILAIIFFCLSFNHQDVTENSSEPVLDLHMSLEKLYTQNLLQRQKESPTSLDLSMGPASGFTINDYTPANAIEQQYECENTRAWTESHRPNEVISNAELNSHLLPDSTGKVMF